MIVLGLGSNLENRLENLQKACDLLEDKLGRIISKSSIIETEPWGFESNNKFLNSIITIHTDQPPIESLAICMQVEQSLGRIRTDSAIYQSRTIDIDILFYDDIIMETDILTIPHPLIISRDFVLIPLKEIIPNFIHPKLKKKIIDL